MNVRRIELGGGEFDGLNSAVRFGDAMSPEAARQLLSSLALTAEPISCPHGRPTTLILPDDQLRRLFKRP